MQKKIIALAIAAAFSAPAFADTTVYGVVDAAVVHISNDKQKSDLQAVSSGLSASRIGFKSVEDVGDYKVVAVLEYGLDTETSNSATTTPTITAAGAGAPVNTTYSSSSVTGTNIAARQQLLALAGGFGTFATGYLQTTGYDWAVKFDPTAGSSVSPLQSMTAGTNVIGAKTAAARAQRALAYISPDLSGVTIAVNYSTALAGLGNLGLGENAPEVKETATLLSATYTGGPLSVGGVYAKTSNPSVNSANDFKEYALGASYDLSVVKLFATYQNNKADLALGINHVSSKVYSFSAVAPVGPGAVVFTYAKSKIAGDAGVDLGGNGYTVGWLQGLSKLTTAYATLSKVTNDDKTALFSVDNNAVGATGNGSSSTMLAVGLNKKF